MAVAILRNRSAMSAFLLSGIYARAAEYNGYFSSDKTG
jgi:hypothetical protein